VERCGEIAFWDSTHNTTRYNYKLATFTVIDSEGSNRAVLLSLNLTETAVDCLNMLQCWEKAFSRRIPDVFMTDDDKGMSAAVSSLSYSNEISHLMCTFHLFEMNIKARLHPYISQNGGGDVAWNALRDGLNKCRSAFTEQELDRLWTQLIQEWFGIGSLQDQKAEDYLGKTVWRKRRHWAVCF